MHESLKSVLVVDDDLDSRTNIKDILDEQGYRTDMAHDGPSALKLVREKAYDVAILDFKMPGMDGAELYREIRKCRPETVSIMITAFADVQGMQQAEDAGTWKILRKPVDIAQLLPLVEQVGNEPLVLVVDDDREFCEQLWRLLRDCNFRVSLAHSENEGLAKIHQRDFQVVIVDLCLANGDGQQILDSMLDQNPHLKKILVTGFRSGMQEMVDRYSDRGVAICAKPFDVAMFLSRLDAV